MGRKQLQCHRYGVYMFGYIAGNGATNLCGCQSQQPSCRGQAPSGNQAWPWKIPWKNECFNGQINNKWMFNCHA